MTASEQPNMESGTSFLTEDENFPAGSLNLMGRNYQEGRVNNGLNEPIGLTSVAEVPANSQLEVKIRTSPKSPFSDQGFVLCRICHGGEFSGPFSNKNAEPLISPCHCRGTMGLYHRSCLEKWLSSSNTEICEICKFQYATERHPQPFCLFLKNPGGRAERRNMIADALCWCFLTPLAVTSAWLCIQGAIHYARLGRDAVEVPGLISLAVFLIITYFIWLVISLRYHYSVWQQWRKRNQLVRIVFNDRLDSSSSNIEDPPGVPTATSSTDENNNHARSPRRNFYLESENVNVPAGLPVVTSTPSATVIIRFNYPLPSSGHRDTLV